MTSMQKVSLVVVSLLTFATLLSPPLGMFVLLVTGGTLLSLWLQGFLHTPDFVFKARHLAFGQLRRPPTFHADIAPREFRYPDSPLAIATLWLLALPQLGVALLILVAVEGSWRERLTLSFVPAVSAAVLMWIAYVLPRQTVSIGPRGIVATQFLGTVSIAWDEIVLVSDIEYGLYGGHYTTDFCVYSRHDALRINERLIDCDDLLELLQQHAPRACQMV